MARLGVDVGSTFVDLVLAVDDGTLAFEKVLADPADLIGSIVTGVSRLLDGAACPNDDVVEVVHATTRGSNTVLERSGPRTALVVTEGFRDVLQIQRALRWSMYDVGLEKPEPLIPRSLSYAVRERMRADGSVATALDEADLERVAGEIREAGADAVAVALINSYANPAHERQAAALLSRWLGDDVVITTSCELSLQAREYERANTAAVNAYITTAISAYLSRLVEALGTVGVHAPVWIMQSSGGLASVAQAMQRPVRSLESGPAAGVVGAVAFGRALGTEDVISFDMGGTTAKAAVVSGGVPMLSTYFELQRVGNRRGSGLPVDIPALDLVEVGTGGGSIAEVRDGTLRVGPRSAGAYPGPACYGHGGHAPTVTDANLVLGYGDPDAFAGGVVLDIGAAQASIVGLAAELGVSRLEAAWAVHRVSTLDMEHAIRLVSINRGFDPREHALVCTGGAGPVHGPRLARALGCRTAIVPRAASGGSARGLLEATASTEVTRTALMGLDEDGAGQRTGEIISELLKEAARGFGARDGGELRLTLGMRYRRQGYELLVGIDPTTRDPAALAEAFHRRYELAYGYRDDQPVEVATWHAALVRPQPPAGPSALADGGGRAVATAPARRRAFVAELGETEVDVHPRSELAPGDVVHGPCLVTELTTTTVALPGDRVQVAHDGSLVIGIAAA